ncbi:GpE family phage tail protein [Escherichia coli]|nr:GpE family phage tail protein [Escherichia coli]
MNKENVITLDNPVKRGEQVIEQVTLMKPNAGTLRGVSLAAVANSEVDALIKVLPRMTAPMLTEQEVAALELPDLVVIFHWPPSELYPMSLTELITWREKALRRSGNTNE